MSRFPTSSLTERIIAIAATVALGVDPVLVHFGLLDTATGAYIGSILGALVASFHGTAAYAEVAQRAGQAFTEAEGVAAQGQSAPAVATGPDRGGHG